MKYLIDTHVLLWAIMESYKLPEQILKLLEDDSPINCIFCTNTMASRKDYMHDKIIVMNPYEAARGDF